MKHPTPSAEELATRLDKSRPSGDGWIACCPAHHDRNPSLSITDKPGGGLLLNCHAGCSYESVMSAAGIDIDRAPAKRTGRGVEPQRWTYHYAAGTPAFHVERRDGDDGGKRYLQQLPDGTWKAHAKPRPPYDLHHLVKHPERPVLIVEGEKAAVAARGMSMFGPWDITTSAGGSAAAKSTAWGVLKGRTVIVWPDADEPGAKYAGDVANLCREAGAKSVRVVDVAGLPDKWDLADPVPAGVDLLEILNKPRWRRAADIELRGVSWLMDRWLPAGALTLFAAPGGSGKGTMWCHLAACLTNRVPWPDGSVSEPVDVAVFTLEDDPGIELAPRLEIAGADRRRVFVLDKLTDAYELQPGEVGAIFLDPLSLSFTGEESQTNVRAYLTPFNELARRTDAAVVGIHHTGKYPNTKLGARARDLAIGSTAWVDCCRWVLMMAADYKIKGSPRMLIRAKGNLGGVDHSFGGYRVKGEECRYGVDSHGKPITNTRIQSVEYVEGNADELLFEALAAPSKSESTDKNVSAQAIMDILRDHGGVLSQPEIVLTAKEQYQLHPNTVTRWLPRLVKARKLWKRHSTNTELDALKDRKIVGPGTAWVYMFANESHSL